MKNLEKDLRSRLERTVKLAREEAEKAARASLEQIGVGDFVAPEHLGEAERELRRRLRIHSRQLGDLIEEKKKTQGVDRLVEEVAYEHWHRMLFARFLAENGLLMCPDAQGPVAVSLEECAELAADEGARNGWELAARYAARMLPQIFRPESPVFQLALPPENQQALEQLVAELPRDVFLASDSLGWVYQFWQSRRKDEVNASEVKIGAREISAVTQLFTEPYMVSFLLDNSLGAWWAGQRLSESTLADAESELALRQALQIPGVPLDYLRFVRQEDQKWRIAAGAFESWPRQFSEIKVIDPCCGSGHFLVATFLMLVPMRMVAERLTAREAVDAVLRDNIHGLEIDQRCVELAVFALALAAWSYPGTGGYRPLPTLNVACTGVSISSTLDRWMSILEGRALEVDLRFYFEQLYNLFSKAPTLGSLINPHRFLGSGLLDDRRMKMLLDALRSTVKLEAPASERYELGVIAEGLAKAAELLAEQYTLVITNVPYLGRGKQDDVLKEHIDKYYPLGKADLATAFVLRCLEFCAKGGTEALVTPQNWLFLTTYTKLRALLLERRHWNILAKLGHGAFETISGQVVNVALPVITASPPVKDNLILGIDVSDAIKPEQKAAMLRGYVPSTVLLLNQAMQLRNPDAVVGSPLHEGIPLLADFASCIQGFGTCDDNRFSRHFWEQHNDGHDWVLTQTAPRLTAPHNGRIYSLHWQNGGGSYKQFAMELVAEKRSTRWNCGSDCWSRDGVSISEMSKMPATLYTGELYDNTAHVILPKDQRLLPAIWCFISSGEHLKLLRQHHSGLKVSNHVVLKVPFDVKHWSAVAAELYPNGLPEPESDDPTQWLFHGRPEKSSAPLQVAVARLLGYRWPAEYNPQMRLSIRSRRLVASCESLHAMSSADNIVCIPAVRGELSAADRLLNLLAATYGTSWSNGMLSELLQQVDHTGKSLDSWLRDKFFHQHCELFDQCPFIWHIWDGLPDGFAALVNYHTLDRKNLETLTYTYLGDWIARQRQEIEMRIDGAAERLAAAENLTKRLELILEGDAPHDIFVRWKPLDQQPVGWEPDIDDGVRLNIRPFLSVPDVKKQGAGILRERPKINWRKDRGKEPQRSKPEFPWLWGWDEQVMNFSGGPEFTGERFNDCHYSLDFKRQARSRKATEKGAKFP